VGKKVSWRSSRSREYTIHKKSRNTVSSRRSFFPSNHRVVSPWCTQSIAFNEFQ
jgi:hypothetical protein